MEALAERVRASRRAAVAERAGTAPVKMLIPLVFLERQGRSSGHKFRVSLHTNRGFCMTRV